MKNHTLRHCLFILYSLLWIPNIVFAGASFNTVEATQQAIDNTIQSYQAYQSCSSNCEEIRKQYMDTFRSLIYDLEASHVMTEAQYEAVLQLPKLTDEKARMIGHHDRSGYYLFPDNNENFTANSSLFIWENTGSGQYKLDIGSSQGNADIHQSGVLNYYEHKVENLPEDGRKLYVRLSTEVSGNWQYNDYVYTAYNSQSDLLKLQSYSYNDAVPYGENMVSGRDAQGELALTPKFDTQGRLFFPIKLEKLVFNLEFDIAATEKADIIGIRLVSKKEKLLFLLGTKRGAVSIEGQDWHYSPAWNKEGKNKVVFSATDNGMAQVFINGAFAQNVILSTPQKQTAYTELKINQINSGYLYSLKLEGSQLSTSCTNSSQTSSNSSCQPQILDAPALFESSKSYEQQGLFAKALETIQQALELDPNNDTYLGYAAHYARYAGQDEIGLRYGIQAIERNNQIAWYHVTTALSAYNLNQKDTAKRYTDSALVFGKETLGQANYDALMHILPELIEDTTETPDVNTPTSSVTNSDKQDACLATYQLSGQLLVPCVAVPVGFVDTQLFAINLQQQGKNFSFALDLNTIAAADNSFQNDCIATYVTNDKLIIPCVSVPMGGDKVEIFEVELKQQKNQFIFELMEDTVKYASSE